MFVLAGLNSRWEAFAQLLTLLVIFIFVLALTYFATRWAGSMQKNKMAGSNIQILETMRVTNSKYIQIVKIANYKIPSVCHNKKQNLKWSRNRSRRQHHHTH